METSPSKKRRASTLKGKKKGGKALARLRSLKGEMDEGRTSQGSSSAGPTDRGFRDVRILTEKIRLLSWVCATLPT